MPWMKLFETLVNGLSILDYCRWELRPRGWEGPGSGSEKKCRNHLFNFIFKFVYESYLLLNLLQMIYEFSLKYV